MIDFFWPKIFAFRFATADETFFLKGAGVETPADSINLIARSDMSRAAILIAANSFISNFESIYKSKQQNDKYDRPGTNAD